MIHTDILIVGAGAGGLMAAKALSAKGKKVIILEARDRAGGRMDTLSLPSFTQPIEAGAEFIHGNLPLTLQLLKENKIDYEKVKGSMLRKAAGTWTTSDDQAAGWDKMTDTMKGLDEDVTLHVFLDTYFKEERYAQLRKSVIQYAQGFDLADENKASVMALRDEWEHEEEEQYRIPGGYIRLADALMNICLQQHCEIHFSETVKTIKWQKGKVEVSTVDNGIFSAGKLIVTVPVSQLQNGTITFIPAIENKLYAVKQIGFGAVIKVLLRFEDAFWEDVKKNALFFLSEEKIPTWWTQYPSKSKVLTGWIGGPKATEMQPYSSGQLLEIALESLNNIFDGKLSALTAWHIANWQKEPYAQGGYSYQTTQSKQAKEILKEPVEGTLYFAGEALYTGDAQGTVEAALASGKEVAEQLLSA